QTFVLDMNLCPFAKRPFQMDKIRYKVTVTDSPEELLQALMEELLWLQQTPAQTVETSLLIHPMALQRFEAYNEFLEITDALLDDLELQGIFQIVSFHPHYQFADTTPDDVENYTNRSPYPMLHILRESSVAQAVIHYPDVDAIPEKNITKLRALGIENIKSRLDELTRTH
ncbi:MAG: DUF1415 domain-containing protein, partial [Bacteroidota bacterium]